MEVEFRKKELVDFYEGRKVKRKELKSNNSLRKSYIKTVKKIQNAPNLNDLKRIASLNLENLTGDLKGLSSVRINDKFRLIIELVANENDEVSLIGIEEISNHYA